MNQYRFIDAHRASYPLHLLCRALAVPGSSWHYWDSAGRAAADARDLAADAFAGRVRAAWEASGRTYGADKVRAQLADEGLAVSVRRVAETMASLEIEGLSGRRPGVTTTRRDRLAAPFADLVCRQFFPARPDMVWYGDITYLWVGGRFWYLAVVIDAATKEVLGWAFADHMRTELVIDALRKAIQRRGGNVSGVIFHSDRGCQYTATAFSVFCETHGIRQSMGRTGVCWDNAAAESFWSTLKRELIWRTAWRNPSHLRQMLFGWIETWYNQRRLHATLGYKTPARAYAEHQKQAA